MKKIMRFSLIVPFLFGCESLSNNSTECGCIIDMGHKVDRDIIYVSEEEQFQRSDLVYIVIAGDKKEAIKINGEPGVYCYTSYSFEIDEVLKGEEIITSVLLFGDTTKRSCISSSIDESLVKGKKYKLYLKKKGEYYFTTAGIQSILLI